ncbi:hypothetical protein CCR75_005924 [Bremia lactucae]|uniref:N-acetyltransferase domain-containing protein n=1 Tax=Bremia lactucae TaxID=4779 RepID=A0A976NZW5_BRELC|nr:hypothetical protein CCR75_005924 [Bremia lactucae]
MLRSVVVAWKVMTRPCHLLNWRPRRIAVLDSIHDLIKLRLFNAFVPPELASYGAIVSFASHSKRTKAQVEWKVERNNRKEETRTQDPRKSRTIKDVTFCFVDATNVEQLHELNQELFPVTYGKGFYDYVIDAPEGYCKLVYTNNGHAIGTTCCDVETIKTSGKKHVDCLCILTLGVLETYRRSKIGTMLLDSVITQARKDNLAFVYLHVQSGNLSALRFYIAHGFQVTKLKRNYYSHIKPPHCLVLRKQLVKSSRS